MSSPFFTEPDPGNDDEKIPNWRDGAATSPVTLDIGGDEPLQIRNFKRFLPQPTTAKSRNTLVKAIESAKLLDADGRHAIARALVQPDAVAPLVKNDLMVVETGEAAGLTQVPGHVLTTEIFPLLQPRTEAESSDVDRPVVRGVLDGNGAPQAILAMRFRGEQHLADFMHQTISHTGVTGNDYSPSILARRVGRPILVHVVRVEFEDGTPSFTVLAVRDGITRLVCSVAARMGRKPRDPAVARQMVDDLLASERPRAGKEPDASQDRARGREKRTTKLRGAFNLGVVDGEPSEAAVRIGQTFTLPANIYLGVQPSPAATVPVDQVFGEAIRGVLGSIHTEFRGWDAAAQAVEVGERALLRAQFAGTLPSDVVRLATGALGVEDTSRVFGDDRIPNTALWRAVYLIHAVGQPATFESVKVQLRSLLGMTRIETKRFVNYLGPLVDVPWRATKARSLMQARRAWGAGGPVPHSLFGSSWEPVPTEDFTTLVPRAIAGELNARLTLQVAGGVSLVADRLLFSNTGSAVDSGTVPFRADPQDVVAGLGQVGNVEGLHQLAAAANAFRADAASTNSFTSRELADDAGVYRDDTYAIPRVDPKRPARMLFDGTGKPELLTPYYVVTVSNRDRAKQAVAEKKRQTGGYEHPIGDGERAEQLRRSLESGLRSVQDMLDRLGRLADTGDPAVGPALGTHEEWIKLSAIGNKVSSWITMHEPPEEDLAEGTSAEEIVDADEENEEEDDGLNEMM